MPALILLVNADKAVLTRIEGLLSAEGYSVVAASSFHDAKRFLPLVNPDLLIADVRLGAFNGLHLAVRGRLDSPDLPVIITHRSSDAVLENEAKRHDATFVVNPLENPEFLSTVRLAIAQHVHLQSAIRRWPRKQVSGVVEAQLAASEARICDMSYGGLRLAFGEERQLPSQFDVTVPAVGLTVKARPVWTLRSPASDEFWCGAEVVDTGTAAMTGWREFVDSKK